MAEPQSPERRLLYRRRPLSPPLSPPVSPPLSPVTYPSSQLAGPIVPRPREGHRRRFSDGDTQWILQKAAQPCASAAEVARRYGIAERVLRRWIPHMAISLRSIFQQGRVAVRFRGVKEAMN